VNACKGDGHDEVAFSLARLVVAERARARLEVGAEGEKIRNRIALSAPPVNDAKC